MSSLYLELRLCLLDLFIGNDRDFVFSYTDVKVPMINMESHNTDHSYFLICILNESQAWEQISTLNNVSALYMIPGFGCH